METLTLARSPASVIVPAGTNSLEFDVPTDELGPDDDAKTTSAAARFNGSGASASLTVNPASVIYVSLPSEVYTHKIAWGKVTIGAPAGPSGVTVRIQSVSENIETPQDAFVPAGQRTAFFPVLGGEVSSPSFGEIVAYTGFTYLYQSTVVVPNPVKIATVSPSTVYGGAGPLPKLTVTLLNAVDKPTLVRLDSSDPGIQVPATLTIPAGSATGSVNVIHSRLPVQTAVTIGAEFCGVRKTTVLTVFTNPLNSLGLSHGQVAGGSATVVTGTIKLRFAVTRDTVVNLSSSLPCASVPATVTIPAGSIGATFVISHFPVASVQLPVVTASIGDEALTKTLSVKKS